MKYIKYLIVFLLFGVAFSCELENNVNPKEVEVAPGSMLFTNAEIALINQVNSIDQNYNNSRLYAQYNTQTTYPDESQWNFFSRSLPDRMWRSIYRDALMDFQDARRLNELNEAYTANQKLAHKAIIDVLEVYGFHVLVDCNGDVPYTQALGARENPTPAYDDAATIYADLISRLTADVAVFNTAGMAANPEYKDADVLYGGSIGSWAKFANSLKLRLAMRLADVNPTLSKTAANQAIASGVMESRDESAALVYPGVVPHVNTINNNMNVIGRKDFIAANTIVNIMNTLNDPRRAYYFTTVGGKYIGGTYGARNVFNQNSTFTSAMREASYPAPILEYAEVEFLLAEAAARPGYTVTGDAESHYKAAVTESILAWGGTNADATAYLAQTEVGYNTGTDAGVYKKKIGLQKWIALYNQGLEGWATVRLFDTPAMNVPPVTGLTVDDFPVRLPYPYNENNLNVTNYTAAAAAIGGDLSTTPLFWDMYDRNGDPR